MDKQLLKVLHRLEQESFFERWLINMFTVRCYAYDPNTLRIRNPIMWFVWNNTKEGNDYWIAVTQQYDGALTDLCITYAEFKRAIFEHYKQDYPELLL